MMFRLKKATNAAEKYKKVGGKQRTDNGEESVSPAKKFKFANSQVCNSIELKGKHDLCCIIELFEIGNLGIIQA